MMVAGALVGAAGIIKEKLFCVAGHMLEASPGDLELRRRRLSRPRLCLRVSESRARPDRP